MTCLLVHVATGVVYGVVDASVTSLHLYCSRGFPICGRVAAERDVILLGISYMLSPPSGRRGQVAAAFEAGAVVVPAAGGPSAGPPEGAVSEGGIP